MTRIPGGFIGSSQLLLSGGNTVICHRWSDLTNCVMQWMCYWGAVHKCKNQILWFLNRLIIGPFIKCVMPSWDKACFSKQFAFYLSNKVLGHTIYRQMYWLLMITADSIFRGFHKYLTKTQAVILDVFFHIKQHNTSVWDKFCAVTNRAKFMLHELNTHALV